MEEKRQILKEMDLFVLDMDGTFFLGESILPGALEFLQQVTRLGKKFVFFTNNASKSPDLYIKKLAGMNCYISKEQIMTSGDVMIRYLNSNYQGKRVYLMGTPELRTSFEEGRIALTEEQPDIVVASFDLTLTYERLERACTYIRNGAVFLATHPDINCPTEDGFIPDCGAICAAVALSTGKQPRYVGKPHKETIDMVLQATGAQRERTAFVGDRLYTDVATGVNNGAKGILVLTGEARLEDIECSEVKPDAVFASLGEMGEILKSF